MGQKGFFWPLKQVVALYGAFISQCSQCLYCGHHGTTIAWLDYRGVCILEASQVGVAMRTRAVEHYKGTF